MKKMAGTDEYGRIIYSRVNPTIIKKKSAPIYYNRSANKVFSDIDKRIPLLLVILGTIVLPLLFLVGGFSANKFERNTPAVKSEIKKYIVKKGDTLSKIARKYKMKVNLLIKFNNIITPDLIYPGQRLTLSRKLQ